MTTKPIALAKARAAKAAAFTRMAELELHGQNLMRLLVCILDHSDAKALVLDDDELVNADPGRLAIANIGQDGQKWVIGVKENASDQITISQLGKQALELVSDPAPEVEIAPECG